MIELNDFDIEAYKREIEAVEAVEKHQKSRIRNYINKNGFSWFENFLDWEYKHEEDLYNRLFTQGESNIFASLITVLRKLGIEQEFENDFQGAEFIYEGYTFQLFQGQGSFWRILKDGENIFQQS